MDGEPQVILWRSTGLTVHQLDEPYDVKRADYLYERIKAADYYLGVHARNAFSSRQQPIVDILPDPDHQSIFLVDLYRSPGGREYHSLRLRQQESYDPFDILERQLRAIHWKAWGKRWPRLKPTMYRNQISPDAELLAATDTDENPIPLEWVYTCYSELKDLVDVCTPRLEPMSILIVREDYVRLLGILETQPGHILITGHPGIGSCPPPKHELENY